MSASGRLGVIVGSNGQAMDNEKDSLGGDCSNAVEKAIGRYQAKANTQIHGRSVTAFGSKTLDVDGSRMKPQRGSSSKPRAEDNGR